MVLICLDYLCRDLFSSNIRRIVDHANQVFFRTRQGLDALFVIQANPRPEHRDYREVLSGFYGEYLEDTPGVRDDTSPAARRFRLEPRMGTRCAAQPEAVSSFRSPCRRPPPPRPGRTTDILVRRQRRRFQERRSGARRRAGQLHRR
jgi:hypothetical protein